MPILMYTCFLFFLALQACNLGDSPSAHIPSTDSVPGRTDGQAAAINDTDGMHRVADDRTAGRSRPSSFSMRDSATGTTYLINPGWTIVHRKARTAKEANLAGTNGLVQTYTDWSGQIETRIYECVSPTKLQHQNSIGCQIEPSFVLVGGGAWADYGAGEGAMLWESRPLDENLTTWVASSKDHVKACPHYLHTYAIGMRLKDNSGNYIPKSTLMGSYIKLHSETTSPPAHSNSWGTFYIAWGSGYYDPGTSIMLGGGARANYTGAGALLTRAGAGPSESYDAPYAQGSTKDHRVTDLHTMTLYGIAFKPRATVSYTSATIPNFGTLEEKGSRSDGFAVNKGVAVAMRDVDPGWVMTSLGGQARAFSGPGRLLVGMVPTGTYSGQVTVYSKDHLVASPGISTAFFTEIRKVP